MSEGERNKMSGGVMGEKVTRGAGLKLRTGIGEAITRGKREVQNREGSEKVAWEIVKISKGKLERTFWRKRGNPLL